MCWNSSSTKCLGSSSSVDLDRGQPSNLCFSLKSPTRSQYLEKSIACEIRWACLVVYKVVVDIWSDHKSVDPSSYDDDDVYAYCSWLCTEMIRRRLVLSSRGIETCSDLWSRGLNIHRPICPAVKGGRWMRIVIRSRTRLGSPLKTHIRSSTGGSSVADWQT